MTFEHWIKNGDHTNSRANSGSEHVDSFTRQWRVLLVIRAHFFHSSYTTDQIRNVGFTFVLFIMLMYVLKPNQKESLSDPAIKQVTLDFLKKKTFHQILRNEILFAVSPRTLESGLTQRNGVLGVMYSLLYDGFLRNEGFKQLGTMIEMSKISGEQLQFSFKANKIDAFCQSG